MLRPGIKPMGLKVMNARVRTAVIVMGFSGLIAEIFLLRELLIVFSGNELCIGIILANWLLLEALGCFYPGRMIDRTENKLEAFALVTLLFSAALIAAVLAIRILKIMLGVSIGEHVGLLPMFYSSFLVLLPVSVLHGALFTFSCRIYSLNREPDGAVAGRVYVDETVGTMAGGVICTFVLIPLLNTFEVVIGVAFLNMMVCLWILAPAWRSGLRQRAMSLLCGTLAAITGIGLLTGQAEQLHLSAVRAQWTGHNVVDGIPEIITPVPDMLFLEEFVHLPMLAHPDPQDILILRGGAGGMIDEVLKHPSVRKVTYAEHDPAFLEVIRKFPTPLTEAELGDPLVRLQFRDGRLLLASSPHTHDIIFVGVMEPSNLQSNRFFTREFFSLAQDRLNRSGILVLAVPGSLTFLSDELKNLNSSIFHSLGGVFPHVRVIPGEHRNLYLASDAPEAAQLDLVRMVKRLEKREIQADGVVPWHIEKKLHDGWRQWFRDYIDGASQSINLDFKPVGLYYHITHWNSLYAPAFGSVYNRFEHVGPETVLPALLLFAIIALLIRSRRSKGGGFGVPFAIVTTGFSGMIFSLILIFKFQVTYGHVFSWIGLLVACIMAGAAIGALLVTRILPHMGKDKRWFLAMELGIIGFTLLLPLIFQTVHPLLESPVAFALFRILFLVLSLVAGMLVGFQYPLANKLQLRADRQQPNDGTHVSRTGGMLYASDLLGGWVGGIAGGVVLLPVMGVTGTCLTVALLKLTSFFITAAEPVGRQEEVHP